MSVSPYAIPSPALQREVGRRRSFAIISHPDAGKTTLTEKFLLYGGALQLAGSVTARKNQRATTSDWMELEKQRGISVSSTVLQFEYKDCVVNILDTPGHKDFSEDTYRVLTAVDAAVMVVDAGKGIESQTRKLFEVCRRRGVPIFTFMNKMDRPARPSLDLLDELENVLGIHAFPVNWPLGDGPRFKGVYDREQKEVHLFQRTVHGAYRAPVAVTGIEDESVKEAVEEGTYRQVCDELELLEGAGADFDVQKVLAGELTPVFFGSAANNFGVQLLLDRFLELAPSPLPRESDGLTIDPASEEFSAFVFKIQANMNPKHRDRVAFVRIVSGKFERDMNVLNTRSGEKMRLGNSQRLFARELRAGVFLLPAQQEHREIQTLPRRPRTTAQGRCGQRVQTARRRPDIGAAVRRGGPAAVRGPAIPPRRRIRRGNPHRAGELEYRPLAQAEERRSARAGSQAIAFARHRARP